MRLPSRSHTRTRRAVALAAAATLVTGGATGATNGAFADPDDRAGRDRAGQDGFYTKKTPTSRGYGGAVTSVDPEASRVGVRVLRNGGNAVDAAVATAAALGVTEPYSAGVGGGGYFVYYDARSGKVRTIDGRETAPFEMPADAFVNERTDEPYRFFPELVTSGVSVGVPGTPDTWDVALDRWGTLSLGQALRPATAIARDGFLVDKTFRDQTRDNKERFDAFTSTRRLFLPGGHAPRVGSVFRNPDLARTYRLLADEGVQAFYRGPLARQIVRTVQDPPKTRSTDLPVPPGFMEIGDLKQYDALTQPPTRSDFRGYDVYGMAPSSSGGSTVGETLNILERFDIADMRRIPALHHYLEASAFAFADRGRYLGDEAFVDVPLADLLSDRFAHERACRLDPDTATKKPVPAQDVDNYDGRCGGGSDSGRSERDTEGVSTTNLTVSDRWGNVVEYTLTIEQTGGSGIVVPERGFLLNNELTDFSYTEGPNHPNQIDGGKRPRSSMSPTIVLRDGKPFLALGTPGGSTIITTVSQLIFNRVDRGMSLPRAMRVPRASQGNTTAAYGEPAFIERFGAALEDYGHEFAAIEELGAATAIEFRRGGKLVAVSEPTRRGGGSALVVREQR